jgi:hypothetical protein
LGRRLASNTVIVPAQGGFSADTRPATQLPHRWIEAKTEAEYKGTVVRLLTEMRLDGTIPFGWIADNTRWMRKPRTYSDMEAALENTAQTYRRQLWDNQDTYVEVWLEKEALAGVVVDITSEFDVPLMVTRGYPSVSFLHEAAEAIDNRAGVDSTASMFANIGRAIEAGKSQEDAIAGLLPMFMGGGKDVVIYYLGDHDPSGVDIARNVAQRLGEFANAYIDFRRVAVTEDQIAEFNLPTRPTKHTDTRAKDWIGGSVELDAIPVEDLRALVRDCIEEHIDQTQLEQLRTVEAEERDVLHRLMSREFVYLVRNGNGGS